MQKKNKLWDVQAKEMNKNMEMLQIWYRSLRTRYGRLLKEKLGDGAAEFTERDEWILSKFSILRAHIYAVKKRTTASVSKIKYPGYPVVENPLLCGHLAPRVWLHHVCPQPKRIITEKEIWCVFVVIW